MIEVLLFANLREQIGQGKLVVDKKLMTVAELKEYLERQYALRIQSVLIAINEEVSTTNEDVIQSGDVVALIPPVSGG